LSGSRSSDIHLVDGTYELFRHYYELPSARDEHGREVAAVRGVLASVLGMMKAGATHVAVANFDTETATLDLPHLQTRKPEIIKRHLEFRIRQFQMLVEDLRS
jgi:hypothetical protein